MRSIWVGFLAFVLTAGPALGADYKSLRRLSAPEVTAVPPLPSGASPRAVQFVRVVVHPKEGEPWAIAYAAIVFGSVTEDPEGPNYKLLTWRDGRTEADSASFGRVFDEEIAKAGFAASGSSLFGDTEGSAQLKVAVLIDELQGRFCLDCPTRLNPKAPPATVRMSAHWEIYSSLDRKVIAKVTTTGGADSKERVRDSFMPAVLDAFREHVRQLAASPEFRSVVLSSAAAPATPGRPPLTEIAFGPAKGSATLAQAAKSVAVVFAGDGSGSGFLISQDGYVLTNQHVVGGDKFVKLKWADGKETLGEVVRTDSRRDVALIKTDAHGLGALPLRRGEVQLGENVFAIGTPLGEKFQNTLTKGVVSASRDYEGQRFIQSDVAVDHGNSGGPLVDEKGQVVAITDWGYSPDGVSHNLNFFIPIDEALRALALKPGA
jgi:S1-C subfamily serine protease